MNITREFEAKEINDYVTIETQPWRHGTRRHIVFVADGAHWAAWIDVHHEDGWQTDGAILATKVHEVERTVKLWEPVAADTAC